MSDTVATLRATPTVARGLDLAAKVALVLLLVAALSHPDLGHLKDKGAGARAIGYPMLAFTLPAVWLLWWRDRGPFPWLADLLVTLTCFTDVLGNRMDLYDAIVWFDDVMHFINTGLLAAAVILLSLRSGAPFGAVLERALAFAVTAAVFWEIAEYFAFLSTSVERSNAYPDTLGDLALGTFGAITAAIVVHTLWRRGRLTAEFPPLASSRQAWRERADV